MAKIVHYRSSTPSTGCFWNFITKIGKIRKSYFISLKDDEQEHFTIKQFSLNLMREWRRVIFASGHFVRIGAGIGLRIKYCSRRTIEGKDVPSALSVRSALVEFGAVFRIPYETWFPANAIGSRTSRLKINLKYNLMNLRKIRVVKVDYFGNDYEFICIFYPSNELDRLSGASVLATSLTTDHVHL
jgi:hypothetical protein